MRPSVSPVENALLVQRNLGNTAYDVVLFVAQNMELIQSVADQLEQAKVVYVVDEEDLGKVDFKLVQNVRTVKGTEVTDWVFVDGKWEKLVDTVKQTKTADIRKNLTISLTEGQTTVGLPNWVKQIYGVFLNGIRLVEGNTYKYLHLPNHIELPKNYVQAGDELTIDIGSLEANRDALLKDLVFIHNKENNAGMALGDGSEQFFELPNTITDVYHNGIRLVHEVSQGGYYDEARGGYVLYSPLAEGDTLVIKYKGEV